MLQRGVAHLDQNRVKYTEDKANRYSKEREHEGIP